MTRDKIPQTETFSHLFLTLSSRCELDRRPQKNVRGGTLQDKKSKTPLREPSFSPAAAQAFDASPRTTDALSRPNRPRGLTSRKSPRFPLEGVTKPPCRAGRRRHRRRPSHRHRYGRRHCGRSRARHRERSRPGAHRSDSPAPAPETTVQALRYKNATM